MKVCGKCGAQCQDFQLYCQDCGAPLNNEPQATVHTITFRRPYQWSGSAREMYITLDDQDRYGVKTSDGVMLCVSPGQHSFKIQCAGLNYEFALHVSEDLSLSCAFKSTGGFMPRIEVRDDNGRIY